MAVENYRPTRKINLDEILTNRPICPEGSLEDSRRYPFRSYPIHYQDILKDTYHSSLLYLCNIFSSCRLPAFVVSLTGKSPIKDKSFPKIPKGLRGSSISLINHMQAC